MALIKVGIHENLVLSDESKINDKGTLELVIKSTQDPGDLLSAFEGNTTFSEMKSNFRFYPPNMEDFDKNKKSSSEIAAEVLRLRHQFRQYALLFATKDKVDAAIGGLAMFDGLGIPADQIQQALGQFDNEAFTQKVVTNLSKKFLEFLHSVNAFDGKVTFRQKFLRQSKAKNYATIPTSDFDVWIEPMTVPKEASKIEFTEYEKTNGKDNPDPVSSSGSETSEEDANKAKDLFSAPSEDDSAPAVDNIPVMEAEVVSNQPDLFTPQE